ncbi:hypothetical protein ACSBR2_023393 [Camellia fascicularis]
MDLFEVHHQRWLSIGLIVLRYFGKDGLNWRKKKDGTTVKEAHERLKAGSVDVLHCYYAHGEENENFQSRSYWLLEEERSNIVLVHYHEVKVRNLFYYFFVSSLLKKFTIDNLYTISDDS